MDTKQEESFVVNPTTGRAVRVGGRIHNQLVRDGLISGTVPKCGRPKKVHPTELEYIDPKPDHFSKADAVPLTDEEDSMVSTDVDPMPYDSDAAELEFSENDLPDDFFTQPIEDPNL